MEFKSNITPYFLLLPLIIPIMDLVQSGSVDAQSFISMLALFFAFYIGMADSFKTIFLKADGIYSKNFYQKTATRLIGYDDIQSLTKIVLNEKIQTLEIFSKDKRLINIQNNYNEFDDFLEKLAKEYPLKERECESSSSPFSKEASKAVTVLFIMVFVVFIAANSIDEYLIQATHLSFESLVRWVLIIYPISTLSSYFVIRFVNKDTALLEAIVVNLLLAPSIAGLGMSINRYINENIATSQIEIPVYLHENREKIQAWQIDATLNPELPAYIKKDKRFYFDKPENTEDLPEHTQRVLLVQQGKLNDLFVTPENMQRLQSISKMQNTKN